MKPGAKPFIIEIRPSRRLVKIRMKQRLREQSAAGPMTISDNSDDKNSADADAEVSASSRERTTVSLHGD
ncbi:hypothetical protein DTW90_17120 [Neorhizobium sp. P12A]|nr:hypothetical protein DTW90_17120 [Neorhizobium sp. P12A]TCR87927.1 hypothetical protein EV561_105274 [Rhizobium sp. BK376]